MAEENETLILQDLSGRRSRIRSALPWTSRVLSPKSILALSCVLLSIVVPAGWHWYKESDRRYLVLLPADGGTINQLTNVIRGVHMAAAIDRVLLLPPIVAGSHYNEDSLGDSVPWTHFVDLSPLMNEMRSQAVDLVPFMRSRQISSQTSVLECHNAAGHLRGEHVYSQKRDAFVRKLNFTLKFSSGFDDVLFHSPPGETTFQQHASYLSRVDHHLMVACISSLFTGLTGVPRLAKESSVIAFRPWLRAAANVFISTSAQDISGSWTDRLGHCSGTNVASTQVLQVLGNFRDMLSVPFLGVHWRRGDFAWFCHDQDGRCYPTLDDGIEFIESTRQDYFLTPNESLVIIATNKESHDEVAEFLSRNYTIINHSELETVDIFGPFAPVWIDLAILDSTENTALIGNAYSTMSLWLQERRAARGDRSSIYFE